MVGTDHHFQSEIEDYLKNFLESSPVRSLAEIIAFNEENAEKELPPPNSNQETLLKSLNFKLPQEEYEQALAHIRRVSRTEGLDKTFAEYGIDILVGPAESALSTFASASGKS